MASQTHSHSDRRITLALTESELADLNQIIADRSLREALEELSHSEVTATHDTDSGLIRAILVCGISAVHGHAETQGYRELANSLTAEDVEERLHYATRHRANWTD